MLSKFSIFTRMCESKSLGKGIFFFLVFVLGWIVGYIQFRFQILF
jgi:Ca2+-dependent lipid-binding protein